MRTIKSTTLALALSSETYDMYGPYDEFVGDDTRPYFANGRSKFYLPVEARDVEGDIFDAGDVLGALRDAPKGALLVCPGYYGAHLDEMDTRYIRVARGWKQLT